MNSNILQAFQTGSALGGAFQKLDQYEHERAVKSRMDELLGEANQHGGDITMLDASRYSDRAGLEAMGRLAAQYSQTEQGKVNIMRNNVIQAKHRYGMMQQYMKDIEDAIKSGDQQRVVGLMSNAGSLSGVPYRFTPTEDGQLAVSYVGADGVHDKGTMTMMEAYEQMKAHMASKGRFIRDSVMYGMGVQEDNLARMMNTNGWKFVTDARGNQYTMIPQTIMRNGQYEPGFIVAGAGGTRNMTLDEVTRSGLLSSAGGGLVPGGKGGLPKSLEMFAVDYVIDADGKQQKFVNPYKYDVISKAVAFGQDPAHVMATWDQRMAEVLKTAPNIPREQASLIVYNNFMRAVGGSPTPVPTKTPDKLDQSIDKNTGGGGSPDAKPDKQETAPSGNGKTYTKKEVRGGKAYEVTYDANGRELKAEPAKRSGKGRSSFSDWRKGVSVSLKEGEEGYRKMVGHGLHLSSDYLHR